MKQSYSSCPAAIDESKLFGFKSWQEHVAAVPSPLAAVTGYKSNGKPNLTMQSWFAVHGDRIVFASVEWGSHMYGILRDKGAVVVNFPGAECFNRCMKSIGHNGWDEDEIAACGLTAEPAGEVDAPEIGECPLSLGCELLWEHEAGPGSSDMTVCLKIVSVSLDRELLEEVPLYNIRSRSDVLTGERTGPEVGALRSLGGYDKLRG